MANFAKLDENNIVLEVNIVNNNALDSSDEETSGIAFLTQWSGGYSNWKQTSYNTFGGEHKLGGTPLYKNYAGIGYTFDGIGFAAPQPYASWSLNSTTYFWEAPTPMPVDDKFYRWDEATTSWVEIPTL